MIATRRIYGSRTPEGATPAASLSVAADRARRILEDQENVTSVDVVRVRASGPAPRVEVIDSLERHEDFLDWRVNPGVGPVGSGGHD